MTHAATSSPPTSTPASTRTSARRCCASSPAAASTTASRTLIGRLLYESQADLRGPAGRARGATRSKLGTTGGELDFALLVDGLAAEREQGITIDVAYRFFATDAAQVHRRRHAGPRAVHPQHGDRRLDRRPRGHPGRRAQGRADADPPAQLPSSRCSASGTSCWRSTRSTWSASPQDVLRRASRPTTARFAARARPRPTSPASRCRRCIGDNVTEPQRDTPWYDGPTLLELPRDRRGRPSGRAARAVPHAGAVGQPARTSTSAASPARSPAARVAAGRRGARRCRRAATSTVARIVTVRRRPRRGRRRAVGHAHARRRDRRQPRRRARRRRRSRPGVADQFAAHVVWMAEEPLLPRPLLPAASSAPRPCRRTVTRAQAQGRRQHAASSWPRRRWSSTRSASCNLELDRPVAFDPYADNRDTGGFILIDRITNDTVGAGMIDFALRRVAATSTGRRSTSTKAARAQLKGQQPCVLWFTGLSGAGKSTIANLRREAAARRWACTPTCSTATTSATA